MLAPASIPVAAGKNTANTVKKLWSVPSNLRKSGRKLPTNVLPTKCTYSNKNSNKHNDQNQNQICISINNYNGIYIMPYQLLEYHGDIVPE